MIFRWEHSFCHHNNFFYYLCEKRVWSFWSCKVVLGDPIFRLVGTFSTHTSQPIESSTGVHPVKFLGISPLNLDDRKSIRAARWYVRGYFLGKKHNEAGHLAKKYKLVIISWSIHNHISCDWTISVCSVYTNKIGTKTTGFEYKVRVACQSYVCHMPTTTPLICIS